MDSVGGFMDHGFHLFWRSRRILDSGRPVFGDDLRRDGSCFCVVIRETRTVYVCAIEENTQNPVPAGPVKSVSARVDAI